MDHLNITTFTSTQVHGLIIWGVIDSLLILAMLGGNILTICAVKFSRKLSAVLSNQFIVSLALSDIMVGISFPYHYAFFIEDTLSRTPELCLLRFCFTILACSSSISNLLGIAMDRYIAIVYPLHYSRFMTKKVAVLIMFSTWAAALTVSGVPVFWNTWKENHPCTLHTVLAKDYINFIITPMFASIWLSMLLIYLRIWREATGHARRLRLSTNYQYGKTFNDSKSVQVVLLILGCFSVCWLPFYLVIIVIKVESPLVYEVTLRMALANSCMNPLIYAWKNSNFRKIFWCLLRCKTPNGLTCTNSFITNHVPRKTVRNINTGYSNQACDVKQHEAGVEMQYTNAANNNVKGGSIHTINTSVNSLTRTQFGTDTENRSDKY